LKFIYIKLVTINYVLLIAEKLVAEMMDGKSLHVFYGGDFYTQLVY